LKEGKHGSAVPDAVFAVKGTWQANLLFSHPCGSLDTVHGLQSGGCGDSSTEREFPSDKVYRRDNRGVVGVESISAQDLAFVGVHTILDVRRGLTVPACLGERRNKTGSGLLASVALLRGTIER